MNTSELVSESASPATSTRFLQAVRDYDRILVVMHDNPDPDAIATGWGVEVLVRELLQKPVRIVGGGAIIRAENRHMVELLSPPIELVNDISVNDSTATVLVDCGVDAANHLLTRAGALPVAIIDHHAHGSTRVHAPFEDIRPDAAASATIAASYLREQRLEAGLKLATAMQYAIRTETCGNETHFSRVDKSVLPWLTEQSDPSLLAEIENAPLTREYFSDLLLALQNTFLYDDAALCFLPRAAGGEIVGEVADMLIRCDSVARVLCAAMVEGDLLLSARTQRDHDDALKLLVKTLEGMGGAGGHLHRAGGKIPNIGRGTTIVEELHNTLRHRWLSACKVNRERGTRLVAKREIVENLSI